MKKEFLKITKLALADESQLKLQTIAQLLCDYEESTLVNIASKSGSFSDTSQLSFMSSTSNSVLVERSKETATAAQGTTDEFWETLDGENLDLFNGIDAELSLHQERNHLHNVLNILRTSIEDYPPEFFLQPPYILETLNKIVTKVPIETTIIVIKRIRSIIKALKERGLDSHAIVEKAIGSFSIKKQVNNVLTMLTNYFVGMHNSFSLNSSFVIRNRESLKLNEIYLLLSEIASFITSAQSVCEIFLNELLNSMANVAKDLRLSYSKDANGVNRLNYIILIYTINSLIASVDTTNISAFCENNAWELETDVALLDVPLKISHSKIYALI